MLLTALKCYSFRIDRLLLDLILSSHFRYSAQKELYSSSLSLDDLDVHKPEHRKSYEIQTYLSQKESRVPRVFISQQEDNKASPAISRRQSLVETQ